MMACLDQYGRSIFRYNPPKDPLDEECDDLILIAKTARRCGDDETLQKLRPIADDFFRRHPEYKHSCWGAAFEENYATVSEETVSSDE